ncbi:MAG: hypothetical protein R2711_11950 [Acidimicrobiales bacterium]
MGIAYAHHQHPPSPRPGVGSEIELAANRKAYLSDEELEGRKLDRTLSLGLLGLFILGIGLPLYWLAEPGRREGAAERISDEFVGAARKCSTRHRQRWLQLRLLPRHQLGVGGVRPTPSPTPRAAS